MVVICLSCNKKIYEFSWAGKYATDVVQASDFKPVGDYQQPQDGEAMLCPECKKPFYAHNYDGAVCLYFGDGTWWPNPPSANSGLTA